MRILKENTLGLLIDVQERLFPHMYEYENLELNITRLVEGLRILDVPVIVTEQYTKGLGYTIPSVKNALGNFTALEKISFSCSDDQTIFNSIKLSGKQNIILFGIETHVCLMQTAVDLLDAGYMPVVIEDCVSSRRYSDKTVAIKRMRQEGARILSLESILFELLRYSGTDTFKFISKLVK